MASLLKAVLGMKYEATNNLLKDESLPVNSGDPIYDPNLILSISAEARKEKAPPLDKFVLLEQEMIASLNLNKIDLAKRIYREISNIKHIKESSRVKILEGMLLEAEGKIDDAREIYNKVGYHDIIIPRACKKSISLELSSGDRSKAIVRLVKYLDINAQDLEAWSQLAKLYIYEGLYTRACFCYEEMLLINSTNHILLTRYADTLYTIGRSDLALKYYCKSLDLFPGYLKALYGLYMCAQKQKIKPGKSKDEIVIISDTYPDPVIDYSKDKIDKLLEISSRELNMTYKSSKKSSNSMTTSVFLSWIDNLDTK